MFGGLAAFLEVMSKKWVGCPVSEVHENLRRYTVWGLTLRAVPFRCRETDANLAKSSDPKTAGEVHQFGQASVTAQFQESLLQADARGTKSIQKTRFVIDSTPVSWSSTTRIVACQVSILFTLRHPRIVSLFDVVEANDTLHLATGRRRSSPPSWSKYTGPSNFVGSRREPEEMVCSNCFDVAFWWVPWKGKRLTQAERRQTQSCMVSVV